MITKILKIFILLLITSCQRQKVDYNPFEKLDLNQKCAVYFIRSEGDWGDFEKTSEDFALTDKTALKKLKGNWGLSLTDKRMACGFGYIVYITQNDKLVGKIQINEPCGYATTAGGWYDFDKDYYDFIDVSKIAKLDRSTADSIQDALVRKIKE